MSKEVMQVALGAINSGHILQLTRAVRELTDALALADAQPVSEILRYEPELYDEDRVRMEMWLDGDYVRYSDYIAALAAPQPAIDPDALAQEIRRVNGDNKMGAGELAERLVAFLAGKPAQPAIAPPKA